jgi:hypothetical protein
MKPRKKTFRFSLSNLTDRLSFGHDTDEPDRVTERKNMTDREQLTEAVLKTDGRNLFDTMQKNLSWQTSRTDEDIKANPDPMADVFGTEHNDPEEYRAYARRTQDNLDQQGREAFAQEHAKTQIKNLTA